MSWALRRRGDRPSLGRWTWRRVGAGPELELPRGHSLLVVGPTQVGKTSSMVVPAILRWRGPVVVTSVKRDVVDLTRPWRERLGDVCALEPGRGEGATWDPLETVVGFRDALGVARDLVVGERSRSSAESEFWNVLAIKLVGALAVTVAEHGGNVYDLVALLERRTFLDEIPVTSDPEVARVIESFQSHEPRTADAVITTAEAMLAPWQLRQPLASLTNFVDAHNTLYLVASRHEQRRYEGLFRGALRTVVAEQQRRHEAGSGRELLLVLDEAATVAPLEDLDQLAATGAGLGITLMSVFQDFAQIEARWGERAATIVNNHPTRLVLGGLVDPKLATYLPEVLADVDEDDHSGLRSWPRGTGVVLSGREPRRRVLLTPWWRTRQLRHRANASGVVTMRRW